MGLEWPSRNIDKIKLSNVSLSFTFVVLFGTRFVQLNRPLIRLEEVQSHFESDLNNGTCALNTFVGIHSEWCLNWEPSPPGGNTGPG